MRILSIDPATNTGWAAIDFNADSASVIAYGEIESAVLDNEGMRFVAYEAQIKSLLDLYRPELVLVEDYFFGSKFASGAKENVAYRTVVHMECHRHNVAYKIINPSEWKRYVCGSTQPSKIQKKNWGKDKAKKWMVQEALWKRYGFKFPNFTISSTGRTVKAKSDYMDAIGLFMFYLHSIDKIVPVSIPDPEPDRPIKGATFQYQ